MTPGAARRLVPLALAAAALCGAGCADEPTRLVVLVDTDVAGADGIALTVTGTTEALDRTFPLEGLARPARVVLAPGDDPTVRVRVSAAAVQGETALLRRTVSTRFVPGRTVALVLTLSASCAEACGPDCGAEEATAAELLPWGRAPRALLPATTCARYGGDGGTDAGPDGGDDAGMDGGPPEGGVDAGRDGAAEDGGADAGPDGSTEDAGVDAGACELPAPPPRSDVTVPDPDDAGCAYPLGQCSADTACETDRSLSVDHCGSCDVGCGVGVLCDGRACDGLEALEGGAAFVCGLARGRVLCWGRDSNGQRGDGLPRDTPRERFGWVPALEGIVELAAGEGHICGRDDAGRVFCWGNNITGVSGGSDYGSPVLSPNRIGSLSGTRDLGSGNAHACAVTSAGDVQCWGSNSDGQLDPSQPHSSNHLPRRTLGVAGAARVSGGELHSCAALETGGVTCWGDNARGQLGDGTTETRTVPVSVTGLEGAVDVVGGSHHTCALAGGGRVLCWGANERGQLGDGTTSDRTSPVTALAEGVAQIDAHGLSTCALTCGGAVRCWGSNRGGQLGDGTTTDRAAATDPPLPSAASFLTVTGDVFGRGSACAVVAGGAVYCWGDNSNGQLGVPTLPMSESPIPIQGLR